MITAIISVATVIVLIKILPQALAIPERLQSYQRLFAISQSLPISFFLVNQGGRIIHANDKALSVFGKNILKQKQSQNILSLFEEEIRLKVQSIFDVCLYQSLNKRWRIEKITHSHNGQDLVFNVYIEGIQDGQERYILLALYDITPIERAAHALKSASERTQCLLDNLQDGVVTLDKNGKIKTVNASLLRMFGTSEYNLLGQNVSILLQGPVPEWTFDELNRNINRTANQSEKNGYEYIAQRWDESAFPISILLTEIWVDGEREYLGVIHDMTIQKAYEERLKSKNKILKQLNEDMKQFVYMVSHDLQEPLRILNYHFDTLTEKFVLDDNEETRYLVSKLKREIGRIKSIIQAVLNYSQIEDIRGKPVVINVKEILSELIDSFQTSNPKFSIEIEIGNILPVKGYPEFITILFQNLISNAIRYNESTPIDIKITSQVWHEDKTKILYSVSDNGIGIAPLEKDKIFDIFQKLPGNHVNTGGLGIGLASCKRIVESHHGKIWVESTEGHGSTFYFTLGRAEWKAQ